MSLSQHRHFHSLSRRLVFSIILWLVGALIFTGLTLNLSWKLEEGGVVINHAGSLRKQIYHIAALASLPNQTQILIEKKQRFNQTLDYLQQFHLTEQLNDSGQHYYEIKQLRVDAQKIITDLIQSSISQNVSLLQLQETEQYIDKVNEFVKLIEIRNTKNIQLLRSFQFLLIAMVILSAFIAVYCLKKWVIHPLNNLNSGIEEIRQGILTTHIPILNLDEFGFVSAGFNQMVSSLKDLYENLEVKVNQKTQALAERNRDLSALYEMTAFLHNTHSQQQTVDGFLKDIMPLCGAKAGSIRLLDKKKNAFEYVGSINIPEQLLQDKRCQSLEQCYCGKTIKQNSTVIYRIKQLEMNVANKLCCVRSHFEHFIVCHIRYQNEIIGILTLYFDQPQTTKSSDIRLIEALCYQLGITIENQRLVLRDRQFAVVEERNLMAQGLHDSIAQSLSFLNLQAQMLNSALKNNETEKAQENLHYIQEGIKESYEDVRELLLNFRVKMHQQSFTDSIQSVTQRFEKQTQLSITFDILGDCSTLDPLAQLQIVFILQEALSNIRKHANAYNVSILLDNRHQFMMKINDDGQGFDYEQIIKKQDRHVGMNIMKERAKKINGIIDITSRRNQGTLVTLTIPKNQESSL